MVKKATKDCCLKWSGSHRNGVTKRTIFSLWSGSFALPRGKGRGKGNEGVKREETEECVLSKWYCQKIRTAIWLRLMLQSRVTHCYFWQLLSLLSLTWLPYRAKPGRGSPPDFPEMLQWNMHDFGSQPAMLCIIRIVIWPAAVYPECIFLFYPPRGIKLPSTALCLVYEPALINMLIISWMI